jgi:hypothetical protein
MSETLPVWKCQLSTGHETGELLNTPLTVGQAINLKCEGDSANLISDSVRLEKDGQPKNYSLKIIKTKSVSATGGEFEVVSYEVGEHRQVSFVLTDGATKVQTQPLSWNVKSVIPPEQQPPPQPFGPFGPWHMSWPLWWWLMLALVITAIGLFVWRKARALAKRRRLEKEVKEYRERHSPFDEFHKELRQYQRKLERGHSNPKEFLVPLENGFKLFLMRTLVLPAPELSDRALRREMKRRHKRTMKDDIHKNITQFLIELKRANREDVSGSDVLQLVEWAQNLSEKIDSAADGSAA